MSESIEESLFQAMDRLCRLAKVLPKTIMNLISYPENKSYQIIIGVEPTELTGHRREAGGFVLIRTTWEELLWWQATITTIIEEGKGNASDS